MSQSFLNKPVSLMSLAYCDVQAQLDEQFIKHIDNILMGQPIKETTESELFRQVDEARKQVALAEIAKEELLRKNLDKLAKESDLTGNQEIDISSSVAQIMKEEGYRVIEKDNRAVSPIKHELSDIEVRKQAEETEKWATQFLKDK
jgi:hypothetical protein